MGFEPLLPADSLERHADAIVAVSLAIEKGDTLVDARGRRITLIREGAWQI